MHAVVAWRIFQAADRGYNGYITPEELKKVTSSIIPSMSRYDDYSEPTVDKTVLFWDVLLWWREVRMPRQLKTLVEENVLERLVVPSDGLWAGVSLNSSLRIWKNMCRSIGYLYRYSGENYLSSACRSIHSHGLSREDALYARIEIVCLFIQECLYRVHADLAKVWKCFAQLDQDARGYLDQDHLEYLCDRLKLPCGDDDFFSPLIHQDRIMSRSESSIDEYSCSPPELQSGQRFMLVEILDFMVNTSKPAAAATAGSSGREIFSVHLDVLPGRRNPSGGFWEKVKKKFKLGPSTDVGKIVIDRLKSGIAVSNVEPATVFRTLVKQYLDLEQWRGQLLSVRETEKNEQY